MLDINKIKDIPSNTGIYLFKKDKKILYIGKSINIKARILSHLNIAKIDKKESLIVQQSNQIDYQITDSDFKAIILESSLIQKYKPKYNSIWKDSKSYLYIQITHEDLYPKVLLRRKPLNFKNSLFFGPFSTVKYTEDIISEIRKIIPFCTQPKISKQHCFYSKINLCSPCPNYINLLPSSSEKNRLISEYQANIKNVIKILNGHAQLVLKQLYRKLKQLSDNKEYEAAIQLRNKIFQFEYLTNERSFNSDIVFNENSKKSISTLKQLLKKYYPQLFKLNRIECFDISNINYKQATGSMVVFNKYFADKSQYRKFKIKNNRLKSDFDMLKEIISRRFNNNKWPSPDLIIIDGGKPQLRIILTFFNKKNIKIPIIGIAKKPDRLIIGINNLPTLYLSNNNQGFNIIRAIRDESHRFAKKYHLLLRKKSLLI